MTKQYFSFENTSLTAPEFVKKVLDRAIELVNKGASMTLTARLSSERPPRDPRHLTDTRTRVSTLLEYSVAYEMNNVLTSEGQGFSVSTVLWNVFPDLLIRDKSRAATLGLEVKALHTAAEEKSANLSTPLPIIRREKDFLVILLWGWTTALVDGVSITYPHIHAVDVFDAWLLAKIRDYGWLFNQGKRIKAVDLCSPIINGNGEGFKAEEGNLGKLMRIALPAETPASLPHYVDMKAEYDRYEKFTQLILALGLRETFLDVCALDGATCLDAQQAISYPAKCELIGRARRLNGNHLILIAGASPANWLNTSQIDDSPNGMCCLWLGQKLNWVVFRRSESGWTQTGTGDKPDSDLEAIQTALGIL